MRGACAPTRLLLIAPLVSLAALLTGCGQAVSVGGGRSVRVALSEYRVSPQSLQSRPGELTIIVENDGRLAHTLAISSHGTIVGQTPPLAPGTRTYLVLTLSAGSYLMSSTLFSDQALGLYGTLTVER